MTQNPGGGDDAPPKTVPEGLLAAAVLTQDEIVSPTLPVSEKLNDAPSPAVVDPNYTEPKPIMAYIAAAEEISRCEDVERKCNERGTLINYLLARQVALQAALMPFATQAMVFANARMALTADDRPNEPAGGTWFSNPPQGIQMQATEGLFFNACDVLGRGFVQDHMASLFNRMQERAAQQAEKDAAVESGVTVH